MSIVVVRYSTQPDKAEENQGLVEKVFAELNADRPAGLRYATFRLADGVSFVHVASVDTDDGANPLNASAAFAEFQRQIGDRVAEGPVASPATVVGSYRFWPSDPGQDVS
jgi:hypothetical protein